MKPNYFYLFLITLFFVGACGKIDPEDLIKPDPPKTEDPEVPEISIQQALFTNPETIANGSASNTIRDELIRYLDGAPKGSTVHVNIYLIDDEEIISAIIRSHVRGVNMNVIIDNSRDTPKRTNINAINSLKAALYGKSKLTVVDSDIKEAPTNGSINHHKHILFSKIILNEGKTENVVFSTSHNFINTGPEKIQDAVILSDKSLYDEFLHNWEEIAAKAEGGMTGFKYRIYSSSNNNTMAYFLPRIMNGEWDGNDNILDILNKISDFENTTVQVGMSDWDHSRLNIAKKLTELRNKGTTVEVIAKEAASASIKNELAVLEGKGGYVNILMKPHNIHSKFMLIDGTWDGKKQKVIVCGTHNYTTNALQLNNELILILKDSPLFEDYQENFKNIKKAF